MPRCRKAETPSGSSASSRAARETLPPDLLAAGVRRLGHVALLMAGSVLAFAIVERLVVARAGVVAFPGIVPVGQVAIVVVSLGMYAVTRRAGLDPAELLDRALVYEVFVGFLLAAVYHSVPDNPGVLPKGFSSVSVLIMAFPLLVPSTRGKTVLATIATALMDPIGLLVGIALGYRPAPSGAFAIALFFPTAIASVIAIIGSRIVYRLSAQAGKAEELGSYRLVAPLGHGGMGEVWRAEHRMLARDAAIKLVRGRDGGIPKELVTRFEREAKATAGLRSPHTVQLYDFGRSDDGAFYYVMELLDGYTLDTLVERYGALAPERVVTVLRQACLSLTEAHGAGLVHRDIKPGNIFLCRYGGEADFVKVVDFGLVKDVSATGGVNLTQTGLIAGTPAYMPPEMALGKEVDGRADLYALGCVGYYLLTAQTVFDRKTALETLHDHTSTPPVPPSQRVSTPIPADLEAVLLDCLAKDPANRPESARVLEERLAATSSAGLWSRADAERWWDRHAPATGAYRPLPTEPEGTRLETPEVRAAAGS